MASANAVQYPVITQSGMEVDTRDGSTDLVPWMRSILAAEGLTDGEWNYHIRRKISMPAVRCRIKEGPRDRLLTIELKTRDNNSAFSGHLRIPAGFDPVDVKQRLSKWHNWNGMHPETHPPVEEEEEEGVVDDAEEIAETAEPYELESDPDVMIASRNTIPFTPQGTAGSANRTASSPEDSPAVSKFVRQLEAARAAADAFDRRAADIEQWRVAMDELLTQFNEAEEQYKRLQAEQDADTKGLTAKQLLQQLEELGQ